MANDVLSLLCTSQMKRSAETSHSQGARHDVVMVSELYLINRVEEGKRSWYMYCINYGRFDDGKGRSELLSQKLGRSPKRAARYAHNHFCPSRNPPLMFATLPQAVDTSLPPAVVISDPVKHLSCAHRFHFHSLVSEIASFKSPRG